MIINNRKDLDAAPDDVRQRFIQNLEAGIHRWNWQNGEWVLIQDTNTIRKFGFTLADFPDSPVPDMPDYNPDQRQLEQEAEEVREQRDALLKDSDWTQVSDAPVADAQAWKDYRQALRDVPEQEGFPTDINWPTKPE